jgi:ribosomal protein S18 acetylase RimI-like enzyme
MAVTILPCRSRKELRLFERTPEEIHRQDPYYVPPFPGSISKIFKANSPFHAHGHGELLPFVALRDGKPVGCIAAIVHKSHNQYYGDKTGFFGFFDFINDREVASALFETATLEIRKRGLETLRGPYNPTVNDYFGVLAEGFNTSPFVMMAYNPPYYLEMYQSLGLKKVREFYAYYINSAQQAPERIKKIVDRVSRTTGITVRNIEMKRLREELRSIQKLYNVTLDRNWGFVPVTYEDLESTADELKATADPSVVFIAEKDGLPVGFSLTLPNLNEFLWKVKSSNTLMRVLKFLWLLKTGHPREARLAVLGVAPEYRNKGIAALFYYETLVRSKNKYIGGEMSWIEESNEEIAKAITVMGGEKYKTYWIYETGLGG